MTTIVLEVPEDLKSLEAPLRVLVAEVERRLADGRQGGGSTTSYSRSA